MRAPQPGSSAANGTFEKQPHLSGAVPQHRGVGGGAEPLPSGSSRGAAGAAGAALDPGQAQCRRRQHGVAPGAAAAQRLASHADSPQALSLPQNRPLEQLHRHRPQLSGATEGYSAQEEEEKRKKRKSPKPKRKGASAPEDELSSPKAAWGNHGQKR
ncbi:uncharacterized protein ACIBXB_003121 [Morphnus guianensis]